MVENKYYERKIRYLDLLENGERTGGVGFVKTEVRGMDIKLAVTVKGLHPTDTYEREVILQAGNGEFAIGRISMKEGQGQFQYHTVMDYTQLQGIRIALGGTREISCKWQENKRSYGSAGRSGQTGYEMSGLSDRRNAAPRPETQGHDTWNAETRSDAVQNAGTQDDIVHSNTLQDDSGKKRTVFSNIIRIDDVEQRKVRELQEIPWDEVRAAEKSLERAEEVLARTADQAAERDRAGQPERGTGGISERDRTRQPERGAEGTSERIRVRQSERDTEGTSDRIGAIWPERGAEETPERSRTGQPERDAKGMSERVAEGIAVGEAERAAGKETGKGGVRTRERASGKSAMTDTVGWGTENAAARRRSERREERMARQSSSGSSAEREKRPVRLMEDKWQQIWAIYPHVRPFQDEREYLSIGPADFVLLSGEAYRAANNSFLLHGYYNYEHLILTKIEKRGEVSYYIGVPGNYYEREKQVAIMFGFESFECGTEPAQAGDFGYYMMRTQI